MSRKYQIVFVNKSVSLPCLVVIELQDSTVMYNFIDSVFTDSNGYYSIVITDSNFTPAVLAIIKTIDCQSVVHLLTAAFPGGSSYDFQICNYNPNQICNAQFIYFEDSVNQGTYHFINQSTNNHLNRWKVNGIIISQQVDFVYTFNTNPFANTVCLEIEDTLLSATDTECSNIIINYCSTSFTYIVNNYSVDFNALAIPNASFYFWDFGDGNTQTTSSNNVIYVYSSLATYNVVLTTYNIFGQDTCVAIYSHLVDISLPITTGTLLGYVFKGNDYLDFGDVLLYSKNSQTNKFDLIDTTILLIDSNSNSRFYKFDNLAYGSYYIKCKIANSSIVYNEYYDTWASLDPNNQVVNWQYAEAIVLNSIQEVANINLKKSEIIFIGGNGEISGKINNTVGINSSDQLIFLLNHEKKIVNAVHPDANGMFYFDTLIYGTYYLRPELINYYTLDYKLVIDNSTPVINDILISIDSNHYYTSINSIISSIEVLAYPNPVIDKLTIELPSISTYNIEVLIEVFNSNGVKVYSKKEILGDKASIEVPMQNNKNGLYVVIISSSYGVVVKKILKFDATN